jgi:hypothetical protein
MTIAHSFQSRERSQAQLKKTPPQVDCLRRPVWEECGTVLAESICKSSVRAHERFRRRNLDRDWVIVPDVRLLDFYVRRLDDFAPLVAFAL